MQLYQIRKALRLSAHLIIIIVATVVGFNCGKRKPPQPPLERISQRPLLSGFQQGNVIRIRTSLSLKSTDDNSLVSIKRIDIYRLAEPSTAPISLSEEEFSARSTLIDTIELKTTPVKQNEFIYTDKIEFNNQPIRLRYAIRFVNSSGQKASFSNFLIIEPSSTIARQPINLNTKTTESAILLSWLPPKNNLDNSIPPNILGYNLYRSINGQNVYQPLNKTPINQENYADVNFEFGKEYTYFVRTISSGFEGIPVESLDSGISQVTPLDTFPPGAPQGITLAAAPDRLAIFFASNQEKDVIGYKIFRSIDADKPKSDWQLLNNDLLKTNTFQDLDVLSNQTYFYYIVAVDNAGNMSQPSEIVSETAQ